MAHTIELPPDVLAAASAEWDVAADRLEGTARRLGAVPVADLSAEVAAAVAAFCTTWTDDLVARAREAADHASALTLTDADLRAVDAAEARRLASLVPPAALVDGRP